VMLYTGSDMPLYAFSLFLPSIINHVSIINRQYFLHRLTLMLTLVRCVDQRICSNCLSFFSGFNATPANLLTVPVYAVACINTCLVGFMADRYGHRGYFNM
jgi:hypothetical protein